MGKRRKRTQRYLNHKNGNKVSAPVVKAALPVKPEPKIEKELPEVVVEKKIEEPSVVEDVIAQPIKVEKAEIPAAARIRKPRRRKEIKAKDE